MPALNAAANILFLVSGSEKATRLAQVLNGPFQPAFLPAQAVKPVTGRSLWLIDQAAAVDLPKQK
jgi:6-phosphogluconolactonase